MPRTRPADSRSIPLPRLSDAPANEDIAAALHAAGYPVFATNERDLGFDALLVLSDPAACAEEFIRQRWRSNPDFGVGMSFTTTTVPPKAVRRIKLTPDEDRCLFIVVVRVDRPETFALHHPKHQLEDEGIRHFLENEGEEIISVCPPFW